MDLSFVCCCCCWLFFFSLFFIGSDVRTPPARDVDKGTRNIRSTSLAGAIQNYHASRFTINAKRSLMKCCCCNQRKPLPLPQFRLNSQSSLAIFNLSTWVSLEIKQKRSPPTRPTPKVDIRPGSSSRRFVSGTSSKRAAAAHNVPSQA